MLLMKKGHKKRIKIHYFSTRILILAKNIKCIQNQYKHCKTLLLGWMDDGECVGRTWNNDLSISEIVAIDQKKERLGRSLLKVP